MFLSLLISALLFAAKSAQQSFDVDNMIPYNYHVSASGEEIEPSFPLGFVLDEATNDTYHIYTTAYTAAATIILHKMYLAKLDIDNNLKFNLPIFNSLSDLDVFYHGVCIGPAANSIILVGKGLCSTKYYSNYVNVFTNNGTMNGKSKCFAVPGETSAALYCSSQNNTLLIGSNIGNYPGAYTPVGGVDSLMSTWTWNIPDKWVISGSGSAQDDYTTGVLPGGKYLYYGYSNGQVSSVIRVSGDGTSGKTTLFTLPYPCSNMTMSGSYIYHSCFISSGSSEYTSLIVRTSLQSLTPQVLVNQTSDLTLPAVHASPNTGRSFAAYTLYNSADQSCSLRVEGYDSQLKPVTASFAKTCSFSTTNPQRIERLRVSATASHVIVAGISIEDTFYPSSAAGPAIFVNRIPIVDGAMLNSDPQQIPPPPPAPPSSSAQLPPSDGSSTTPPAPPSSSAQLPPSDGSSTIEGSGGSPASASVKTAMTSSSNSNMIFGISLASIIIIISTVVYLKYRKKRQIQLSFERGKLDEATPKSNPKQAKSVHAKEIADNLIAISLNDLSSENFKTLPDNLQVGAELRFAGNSSFEGGFGSVRKVINVKNNKSFALKMCNDKELAKREVAALYSCRSPYIVSLDDYTEKGDYYFLTLEWLDYTLEDRVQRQPMDSFGIRMVIGNLQSALECMHQYNYIHTDLKPQNVMFSSLNGNWKLIDLGSACKAFTDSVGGISAQYCPPEVARALVLGQKILAHPSIDVWQLGLVVFFMFMRSHPMFGSTEEEILANLSSPSFNVDIDGIPDEQARHFLQKIFVVEQSRRLTLDGMKKHAYLSGGLTTNQIGNMIKASPVLFTEKLTSKIDAIASDVAETKEYSRQAFQEIRSARRQLFEQKQYTCPRLCIMLPEKTSMWNPKQWLVDSARLHLLCEHENSMHFTDSEGYKIERPKELLRKIAPVLSVVTSIVSIGLKISTGVSIPDNVKRFIDSIKDHLPSELLAVETAQIAGKLETINGTVKEKLETDEADFANDHGLNKNDQKLMVGAGLREFKALLKQLDPKDSWGGLQEVVTADGEVRHVCPQHAISYHLKEEKSQKVTSEIVSKGKEEAPDPVAIGETRLPGLMSMESLAMTMDLPRLFEISGELSVEELLKMTYKDANAKFGFTTDEYMKLKAYKAQLMMKKSSS